MMARRLTVCVDRDLVISDLTIIHNASGVTLMLFFFSTAEVSIVRYGVSVIGVGLGCVSIFLVTRFADDAVVGGE